METIKISILGMGLIGGSIAKSLKASGNGYEIYGFDKKETVLDLALKEKSIDYVIKNIDESLETEIIFLCLPADISLKIFKYLIPKIRENTIITDVCGVKGIFEEAWIEVNSSGDYIGGHPMTGKEAGGYENSDSTLFENSLYIISSLAERSSKINLFLKIVDIFGAKPVFLNPDLHDKVVARISHLPQLLAISLVNSVGNENNEINFFDFAAGGFRDLTRIASSPFSSWKSILKYNREEIITAIELIHHHLTQLEDYLQSEDFEKIDLLFKNARIRREKIAKNSKGFLTPLHDVFFKIEDKPGRLSKVLKILYEHSLNVKDIELQKFNEKYGGIFRISFESEKESVSAKDLLTKAGYQLFF